MEALLEDAAVARVATPRQPALAVDDSIPWERVRLRAADWFVLAAASRQLRRVALDRLRNGEPLDADLRQLAPRRCGDALASLARAAPGRLCALSLDIRRLPGPPALLGRLLSPRLVTLRLRNISAGGARLGAAIAGAATLGQACPSLRQLDLTCSDFGGLPEALASFPATHPLEELVLAGCAALDGEGGACALRALPPLGHLSRVELAAVAPGGRRCFYLAAGALADGLLAVKQHASAPPSSANPEASSEVAAAVASPSPSPQPPPPPALAAAPYPRLTTVGLRGQRELGARDAAALAARAPALARLHLSGAFWRADVPAPAHGDGAVPAAIEDADALLAFGRAVLPRLEVLVMANTQPDGGLCDDDVRALLLAPAAPDGPADRGAAGAAPLSGAPRLAALDIGGHAALTDAALEALACDGLYRGGGRLRRLVLSRQPSITRRGLLALLRASPQLNTVIAIRCRRLSARVLARVARELASDDERPHAPRLLVEREGEGNGDDNDDESWWLI